jgi:hypothetical protein
MVSQLSAIDSLFAQKPNIRCQAALMLPTSKTTDVGIVMLLALLGLGFFVRSGSARMM